MNTLALHHLAPHLEAMRHRSFHSNFGATAWGRSGSWRALAVMAVAAGTAGCGDDSATQATTATGGGVGGADGMGGAGGQTTGGTGGDEGETLSLAIVGEDGPGNAPSLLRFSNDTATQLLALALNDGEVYAFYEVPAGTLTEYRPSVGTDMANQAEIGFHEMGFCVNFPVDEFAGEEVLQPGQAYRFAVTTEDEDSNVYSGSVTQEQTPSAFLGLRAVVAAPGPGSPAIPVTLRLETEDPIIFEGQFDPVVPGPYKAIDGTAVMVDGVSYTNRFGQEFTSDDSFVLEGHGGYTLIVTEDPPADALRVVTLSTL